MLVRIAVPAFSAIGPIRPPRARSTIPAAVVTRVSNPIPSRSATHRLAATVRFLNHHANTAFSSDPFAPRTQLPFLQPSGCT